MYWNLPWQMKYKSEISYGNQLIEKLEKFRLQNDYIPHTDDWQTLKTLDFKITESEGWQPMYQKINEIDYIIINVWNFDPPYLYYCSKTKEWELGFNFPYPERTKMIK
jgi:hypothetical protein